MTTIEQAKQEYEVARLAYATEALKKRAAILAKYDATESNRMRRQATRETKSEGEIYDMSKRLLGCNLGRDLERNYSPAKSIMHQFRINVVGSLGKLKVNTEDGKDATDYFNEVFAKDCDFRDDMDWSTMLQNILASEIRDGDMLAVFDDGVLENSGKLVTWEADQIAPVSDDVLKASEYKAHTQDNGILRTKLGRVDAYCVTGKRGMTVIDKKEDVTYWKRGIARLVKNPWRLNQGRGIPSLITPSTNFIDLYEILSSELLSAKRAAKQYAIVKRDNSVTDWDTPASSPEFLPENDGRVAADVALDGANQTTHTARNYEKLETFTGGLTDYLDPLDAVEFPDIKHPNPALTAFLDAVHGFGGSALGIARAYTILRADSSYTAFRGDMLMTWVTFYWMQKHIERTIADWTSIKVLTWAQNQHKIGTLKPGWERALSWTWPTMAEVDPVDYETAVAQALKNGTTDYSNLLGPDWERRLRESGKQVDVLREINYPAGVLETKSGGAMDSQRTKEKTTKGKNE
jgi:capsid protein